MSYRNNNYNGGVRNDYSNSRNNRDYGRFCDKSRGNFGSGSSRFGQGGGGCLQSQFNNATSNNTSSNKDFEFVGKS